jgi:hypothetical protein
MSTRSLSLFLSVMVLLGQPQVRAEDDKAVARTKKELLSRPITLNAERLPLSNALAELARQTGNHVADRRQTKTDPGLKLDLNQSTFWPALEAIAKAAGCGISTYQPDGKVALVDGSLTSVATVYQGIVRVFIAGIAVSRDDKAGTHVCTVTLDIAWEPRFEPLYLEVGPVQAKYAADNKGMASRCAIPSHGKISVAGLSALVVPISLPAPSRSSPAVKTLEVQLQLTGPGKMLTFAFPNLNVSSQGKNLAQGSAEEGVQVSLSGLKTASNRWSIEVVVDNSNGNPIFESYQSWLGNNQIRLEKGDGSDRVVWSPRAGDEQVHKETATQAKIVYSFHIPPRQSKGLTTDWTLIYRTPGRIVEMAMPFAFKEIPLP